MRLVCVFGCVVVVCVHAVVTCHSCPFHHCFGLFSFRTFYGQIEREKDANSSYVVEKDADGLYEVVLKAAASAR